MPDATGSIIDESADGKSSVDADNNSTRGDKGRTPDPEILYGHDVESPATERIGNSAGEPRRTKSGKIDGRTQRGKRTAETGEKESVRLESLKISDLLYSIHLMGAEMLKTPELELDKDECVKLADAVSEVSKHYTTAFNPKTVAWVHLAVIAGGIYGTRIFAVRNRIQMQRSIAIARPKVMPSGAGKANGAAAPAGKTEVAPEALWGMGGTAEL
jgi:hypothetical protein